MIIKKEVSYDFKILRIFLTVSKNEHKFTVVQGAEGNSGARKLDHDEPPNGQGQGQEDGDSVDEVAEVAVKQHEVAPAFRHPFLPRWVKEVLVVLERNVFEHVEAVSDGYPGEDQVDWVNSHVLVGEDRDVDNIEDTTENADIQRQMTVNGFVKILQSTDINRAEMLYFSEFSQMELQFNRKLYDYLHLQFFWCHVVINRKLIEIHFCPKYLDIPTWNFFISSWKNPRLQKRWPGVELVEVSLVQLLAAMVLMRLESRSKFSK